MEFHRATRGRQCRKKKLFAPPQFHICFAIIREIRIEFLVCLLSLEPKTVPLWQNNKKNLERERLVN